MLGPRFRLTDDEIAHEQDPWGYSYRLSPAAQACRREGLRFIRRCYYALVAVFLLAAAMIAYLVLPC